MSETIEEIKAELIHILAARDGQYRFPENSREADDLIKHIQSATRAQIEADLLWGTAPIEATKATIIYHQSEGIFLRHGNSFSRDLPKVEKAQKGGEG